MAATNSDVATRSISSEELNTAVTIQEAIAAAQAMGLTEEDMTVVVNPYEVLNQDKDPLLGVAFFIRYVRFAVDEKTGAEYAVLYCVTRENKMYVVTDGSTGIYRQLLKIVADYGRDVNFFIPSGLRKSDYEVEINGRKQPATTYYLA